jgi:hypothetical protein
MLTLKRAGQTFYNMTEVCDFIRRSRTTVWRWKQEEKIPKGRRYRDKELLFTQQEMESIYAYAHRMSLDEASAELKHQLRLF